MKVARSIALSVLAILMMAGCRTDSQSAGLDSDPTAVVALRITPASAQLAPADTLRFSVLSIRAGGDTVVASDALFEASGGTVSGAGLYQAGGSDDGRGEPVAGG